jgi:hypothetical protein
MSLNMFYKFDPYFCDIYVCTHDSYSEILYMLEFVILSHCLKVHPVSQRTYQTYCHHYKNYEEMLNTIHHTFMAREWCHNSFSHSAKQIRQILSFCETNSANYLIRLIISFGELSHSANYLIRRILSFGEFSHSANSLIRRTLSFGKFSHSANSLIRLIVSFG